MANIKNSAIPDVGQSAPDFQVPTAGNQSFQLSEALQSSENILLIFYRGHW